MIEVIVESKENKKSFTEKEVVNALKSILDTLPSMDEFKHQESKKVIRELGEYFSEIRMKHLPSNVENKNFAHFADLCRGNLFLLLSLRESKRYVAGNGKLEKVTGEDIYKVDAEKYYNKMLEYV